MGYRAMNYVRTALFIAALLLPSSVFAQWATPDHSVPIGRGGGTQGFKNAAPAAAGQVLTSNGSSADPSFQSVPAGPGIDVAALKAMALRVDGSTQYVNGYYAPGDGGEGDFTFNAASTATPDDGVIIAPNVGTGRWVRNTHSTLPNLRWWGAKCDATWTGTGWTGSADDGYYSKAINWGAAQNKGAQIRWPRACKSALAGTITIASDNISFTGEDSYTQGIPIVRDDPSCTAQVARIGGFTGPMFVWRPGSFGAAPSRGLISGGMSGVCLDGSDVVSQAIVVQDMQTPIFSRITAVHYATQGMLITPSANFDPSHTLSVLAGIQEGTFDTLNFGQSAGGCIKLGGYINPPYTPNVSLNTFSNINCNHLDTAPGILNEGGDNNTWVNIASRGSSVGSPAYDFDWSCAAAVTGLPLCATSEAVFRYSGVTTIIRGTTTFPTANPGANGINIYNLDNGNAATTPILEPGARFNRVVNTIGETLILDGIAGAPATVKFSTAGGRGNLTNSSTSGNPDLVLGHDGATGNGLTYLLSNNTNQMIVGNDLIQALKPMRSTNSAAAVSPSAGLVNVWTDSTDLRLHDKNSAGTIGTTVVADTGAANNFLTGISAAGVVSKAQPSFSNISGQTTVAQLPNMGANTALVNATSGTAAPTAFAMPSCSAAASALIWTTSTGFGCNAAIAASSVAVGSVTGLGTGVAAALAVNVGTAGAPVVNGGALGTPLTGVGTNLTGTAASLTAGNATKLTTPRAIGVGGTTGLTATGVNFDGSAAINPTLTGTLAVANGGTGIISFGTNVAAVLGNAAFAPYTPTVTTDTATGTYSGAFRYLQFAQLINLTGSVTCTTVGTGNLFASLPVTVKVGSVGSGTYFNATTNTSGAIQFGLVNAGRVYFYKADGTFPCASGQTLWLSGFYEGP